MYSIVLFPDVSPPVFDGAPFVVWGLTAYILERMMVQLLDVPVSNP